ncbi:hypothetical protein CWB41_02745 [Methylovirgula ligni]|uniref:Uncharacterized protein n=1 Tax=Methylovirgula ligni TaxID=569860 RepID=A0A3D9YXC3_9HYPH|nr:hypothetical protein [Methylovirgula ligni]QAY94791.1 hypothetical protein CWB41_02745 [Methylovirgula ligni]REF87307.1 hypothetical protein DES32_0927 [Methylovirgula ligni]
MTLAVLDGGTFYHHESIHGARYRDRFDRVIYAPELRAGDLDNVATLIVPDRIDPVLLRAHRPVLLDFLDRKRTLIVLGQTEAYTWAPGVRWLPRPINYWWWLEKDAVPVQQLASPDHELFHYMPFEDAIWHFHGILLPPPGAEALVTVPGDPQLGDPPGALLYEDRVSTPGRLLVSTLDPFYHNGSHFMAAATRFLKGLLDWANATAAATYQKPIL